MIRVNRRRSLSDLRAILPGMTDPELAALLLARLDALSDAQLVALLTEARQLLDPEPDQ